MAKKVSFNMLFDETQKEILEYVIDEMYGGADITKASFIQWLIRNTACDVLDLVDEEREGISDEMILALLKHHGDEKQLRIIDTVGLEKYKDSIEKFKKTNPEFDSSYSERMIKLYESTCKKDGEING